MSRLRSPRALAAGALVVGATVGLLAWVLLFSSLLAARDIAVTGASSLTPEEVIDAAHVPLGRPLARLDLRAIQRSAGSMPSVRVVHVYRRWPHTVEIEVAERRPVGVVAGRAAGDWSYVDAQGVFFGIAPEPRADASPTDRTRLPRVIAAARTPAARAAGEVLAALPASLSARVVTVRADSPESVVLLLPGKQKVVWGDSGRPARKAAVLAALLVARPSSFYDVSSPDTPTLR